MKAVHPVLPLLAMATLPLLAPSAALAKGPSLPAGWATYANARFGYTICYPATALHPQAEADNGDGRVFTGTGRSGHGTSLRVWGQHNALDQTIDAAFAADQGDVAGKGGKISYAARHKDWYVLSGQSGARKSRHVFYIKKILNRGRWLAMEVRYPLKRAEYWDGAVARMSRCFGRG